MLNFSLPSLFRRFIHCTESLHKTCVANFIQPTKGARNLKAARKPKKPEELEDLNYYGIGPHKKVQSMTDSLSARGFPKGRVSYNPPADVTEKLQAIYKTECSSNFNSNWKDMLLSDPLLKFKILTKCIKQFGHDIPSSYLCKLRCANDLVDYFNTPVDGALHYDALIRDSDKLPKNLHVIQDEIVFNPETDTFFDGVTAFPNRKRIIFTKRGEEFEKTIEWPHL